MSVVVDGYCTPGTERETQLSADSLLQQMNAAGIDRAVVAPEDREIAVLNRDGNARIASMAKSHARFIPACAVNPWFGRDAVEALKSALGGGARMLVFAPAIQGFCLTDEVTDPLMELAAARRLPVYVHTGPHSFAAPAQLVLLAQRHPSVRFIMGHCGSTDHAHDMPAILHMDPQNVWYEVSFVRPWALPAYASVIDESRLIFATAAPRNDIQFEMEQFERSWPKRDHPGTYGGNLLRLLEEVK